MADYKQTTENTILKALRKFTGDRTITPQAFKLTRMPGFSNDIYKIEHKGKELIIKKKVGEKKTKLFIHYEPIICKIVKENTFGPTQYHEDEDVIIEEFIPSEVLTIHDILSNHYILKSIDQAVLYNNLTIKPEHRALLNHDAPIYLDLVKRGLLAESISTVQSNLDATSDPVRKAQLQEVFDCVANPAVQQHIHLLATKFNKNLVLGHNDFYRLNLLKSSNKESLTLIDYEYSGFNPIGWDLANFFCERCLCYDEEKNKFALDLNLPRTKQRTIYFKYYLLKTLVLKQPSADLELDLNSEHLLTDLASDRFDQFVDSDILTTLVDDFYSILQVINFFWITWCTMLFSEEEERWPVLDYTVKRVQLQKYLHQRATGTPSNNYMLS